MLDERSIAIDDDECDMIVDTPMDAPLIHFLHNSHMHDTGELLSRIEAAFNARAAGEYSDDLEFTRSVTDRLSINDLCGDYDGLPYISDDTADTMLSLLCIVLQAEYNVDNAEALNGHDVRTLKLNPLAQICMIGTPAEVASAIWLYKQFIACDICTDDYLQVAEYDDDDSKPAVPIQCILYARQFITIDEINNDWRNFSI